MHQTRQLEEELGTKAVMYGVPLLSAKMISCSQSCWCPRSRLCQWYEFCCSSTLPQVAGSMYVYIYNCIVLVTISSRQDLMLSQYFLQLLRRYNLSWPRGIFGFQEKRDVKNGERSRTENLKRREQWTYRLAYNWILATSGVIMALEQPLSSNLM